MKKQWILWTVLFSVCTAVQAQMPPPPPDGHDDGPEKKDMRRGPRRGDMNRGLENILKNLPEADQTELRKQIAENPSGTRQILRNYFEEKRKKEMEEIGKLRTACLQAKDEESKKAACDALEKYLAAGLDRHLQRTEQHIQTMEKQLAEFQAKLDEAKKRFEKVKQNRDAELQKMMKDITDPSKQFPPPPPSERNGKPGPGGDRMAPPPPPPPAE